MRRVLVLRPEPGASATVDKARQLGLDAVAMLRTILLASAAIAVAPAAAQSFDSASISGLGIRNIGSATMIEPIR